LKKEKRISNCLKCLDFNETSSLFSTDRKSKWLILWLFPNLSNFFQTFPQKDLPVDGKISK
jgi:hypothetical protein